MIQKWRAEVDQWGVDMLVFTQDETGGRAKNLVQELWKFITTSLTQQFTHTADSEWQLVIIVIITNCITAAVL